MISEYEWHDEPPKEDGDFYYSGPTPDGDDVLAIVQVFTHPDHNIGRMACLLIPPGWRGNKNRRMPTVCFGDLSTWQGQWAGPEYGLCTTVIGGGKKEGIDEQSE